ncbi:hypothetical protein QP994_03225 [Corynebacterium sp. MSK044]|uniref:hypothetical protein n=1 Tax=Corynebacterium sp. MSK044 TaxID=3050195 RepID=UPI0025506A12|nr:hypothetical protein [Corynebacterium sp. MSK044]MDK8796893.1 hypothetical protein [Corynebacterium sp. MSK044]
MVDSQLAQLLHEKYALTELKEKAATADSTVYFATNTWGNSTAEVELFNEVVEGDRATAITQLASGLRWLDEPAVVSLRDCGVTEDGKLYVVRDEAKGNTLRSIIEGRVKWGTPFSNSEAHSLLAPVASAIDHYNNADHADLLARSLNVDNLLVQQGNLSAPVMLAMVGPTPDATSTAAENRRTFAEIISQLTTKPVDEELLESTVSASDYLEKLAFPHKAQPEAEADDATVQWGLPAQPVEEQPERPKQHFPDTNPGFPPVQPQYQQPYGYPAGYGQPAAFEPQPKKKSKGLTWLLVFVILLLLGGIGAGGWWLWNNQGEDWNAQEQKMADTFPRIISEKSGQRGWLNMKCQSQSPEDGQKARIRCSDQDLGVSIIDYGDEQTRDSQLPDGDAEVIGNEKCSARSYKMEDVTPPAYRIVPEGEDAQYLFVVNGGEAESKRMYLNLCEKSRG